LDRPEFKSYLISKSDASKTEPIMNIDNIPSYVTLSTLQIV